jgi:hypothetical protein
MSEETGSVPATGTENETTEALQSNEATESVPTEDVEKPAEVKQEVGTESELDSFEFDSKYNFSEEQKKQSLDFMKQIGVTNKQQADKLIGFLEETDRVRAEQEADSIEKMLDAWDEQLENDEEFSKDYNRNIDLANKALMQYGGKELEEWLDKTGFNRKPEIVKMFYRIGKDLEEARVLNGASTRSEVLKHDKAGRPIFNFDKSFGDK